MALISLLGLFTPAHADAIDERAGQLTGQDPYKVRLSAAVWLARQQDDRAVVALSQALAGDSEHTVRRVAASGLGTLVTQQTAAAARDRALAALQRAAEGDANARVRRSAKRSLARITAWHGAGAAGPAAAPARTASPVAGGTVFVGIAPVRMGKKLAPAALSAEIQATVKAVLSRSAPAYALGAGEGELPTRAELDGAGMRGWLLGASIAALDVARSGAKAEVRCTVSLQVNPWSGRDVHQHLVTQQSASASGSGTVTSANTDRGIDAAKRDCVQAVAEQVMTKQVVPYLRKQNP